MNSTTTNELIEMANRVAQVNPGMRVWTAKDAKGNITKVRVYAAPGHKGYVEVLGTGLYIEQHGREGFQAIADFVKENGIKRIYHI